MITPFMRNTLKGSSIRPTSQKPSFLVHIYLIFFSKLADRYTNNFFSCMSSYNLILNMICFLYHLVSFVFFSSFLLSFELGYLNYFFLVVLNNYLYISINVSSSFISSFSFIFSAAKYWVYISEVAIQACSVNFKNK